ncbi:hypothetical protein L1D22_14795 [Vibrio sp. Isolate34]|uniref:hypothetical protein n=1 Tax=Vibrio sp. Isolate34 TaxID=2908540 RepID=UPI001EFCBF25|nr:hypothetical protein [Vibrio sp. Isolate34]MCG9641153.1 hypothetical protein [Vibrio sp. Isolate34]
MNRKHIIKTIQMGIVTTALMSGMALANTTDLVESTDAARAQAHTPTTATTQQIQAENATHKQALQTLESNGSIDQYMETNKAGETTTGHVSKCVNTEVPLGEKVAEHCK